MLPGSFWKPVGAENKLHSSFFADAVEVDGARAYAIVFAGVLVKPAMAGRDFDPVIEACHFRSLFPLLPLHVRFS
ncbi:MAG TPA: hypothetical protein DCY10_04020 [Clostridiales bacterium]|nr:hypothetical protein [Clostridiales bacterium]